MSTSNIWCLYHPQKQIYFRGLSISELSAIFAILPHVDGWFVWKDGWKKWKSVESLSDIFEVSTRISDLTPPAFEKEGHPEKSKSFKKGAAERTSVVTSVTSMGPHSASSSMGRISRAKTKTRVSQVETKPAISNERTFGRVNKHFVVAIDKNGKQYRSRTLDISAGGVRLEDPLPEWISGYFTVSILKPETQEMVEVTCSVVENQEPGDRCRLMFDRFEDPNVTDEFEQWIAA